MLRSLISTKSGAQRARPACRPPLRKTRSRLPPPLRVPILKLVPLGQQMPRCHGGDGSGHRERRGRRQRDSGRVQSSALGTSASRTSCAGVTWGSSQLRVSSSPTRKGAFLCPRRALPLQVQPREWQRAPPPAGPRCLPASGSSRPPAVQPRPPLLCLSLLSVPGFLPSLLIPETHEPELSGKFWRFLAIFSQSTWQYTLFYGYKRKRKHSSKQEKQSGDDHAAVRLRRGSSVPPGVATPSSAGLWGMRGGTS